MRTKEDILPDCPAATTVSLIGSKWKLLIMRNLPAPGVSTAAEKHRRYQPESAD